MALSFLNNIVQIPWTRFLTIIEYMETGVTHHSVFLMIHEVIQENLCSPETLATWHATLSMSCQ